MKFQSKHDVTLQLFELDGFASDTAHRMLLKCIVFQTKFRKM